MSSSPQVKKAEDLLSLARELQEHRQTKSEARDPQEEEQEVEREGDVDIDDDVDVDVTMQVTSRMSRESREKMTSGGSATFGG